MALPMSLSGRPGLTASMPSHIASSVTRTSCSALRVDVADEERGVGVAVHPAVVGGDVEVDDVAVLQRPESGMPWQMTSLTDVHTLFG